ncbi:MAG: hypothetical protein K2O24_01025 [Muribaculaceae bacterium]|nr:hypothetical protein [Muribaculaceae bacterium]
MKPTVSRLLYLFIILCGSLTASSENIILSHEGTARFFDVTEMDEVLKAAAPNDTIFLPDTPMPGFTVTKDFTIMGSGENTIILGNITISPENTTPWKNVLLDGITVQGDIDCDKPTDGLHIRRTTCRNFQNGYSTDLNNTLLENCHIKNRLYFSYRAKNCQIINCVIEGEVTGDFEFNNIRFLNCTIKGQNRGYYKFYAINSIIRNEYGDIFDFPTESYLENCLILHSGDTLYADGYVKNTTAADRDSFGEVTKENLLQKGYLGTDGTVIGHWGGRIGFSLEPTLPYIKEKQITLDENGGELKVNVTLGGIEEGSVL